MAPWAFHKHTNRENAGRLRSDALNPPGSAFSLGSFVAEATIDPRKMGELETCLTNLLDY